MTFDGVVLLLVFLLVVVVMVRVSAWICRTDPLARAAAADPQPAAPPATLPTGWTVADYAADGIRSLQVLLAQRTRDSRS
jgi:hypothetical protein